MSIPQPGKSRRRLLAGTVVAALATAAGALGSAGVASGHPDAAQESAAAGRTLVFGDAGEPSTIDPAIANIDWELHVTRNVYDALTTYPLDNLGKVEPALATSWSVKGKVWTFKLRKGVKFHSGKSFSAKDVKVSLDRTLKIAQGEAYLINAVKNVKVVNPYTVRITTKQPNAFLAANLTHIGIVSAADVAAHQKGKDLAQGWFQSHADGTGPYRFVSWAKGSQIVLDRNTDWWGKFPKNVPNKVIDKFVTDGATRARGLEGHAYDFADFVPHDDALRIGKESGFREVKGNNLFAWPAIYLNLKSAPTSNAKFREALVKAFDYKAMIDFYKGTATTPRGPIPSWYPGSPEATLPAVKQDMSAAKTLLSASGLSHTSLTCSVPSGFPEFDFAATVLQSSASTLGITVNIRTSPFVQAINMIKDNKAQCFVLGNAILSPQDPTAFFSAHYVTGGYYNSSHYNNPAFDKLVDQISATFSKSKRYQLVKKASQTIMGTHMIIFTSRPQTVYAVPKYLTGYKVDGADYTGIRFYELSLNR